MKTIKINVVDFWRSFDKTTWFIVDLLRKHYNVIFSEEPDFLFCSCFSNEHENYTNCVKIFYTGENVLPDFNKYDYAIGFDYINFGDRYFRQGPRLNKSIKDRDIITSDFAKRKFCNFIYSNSNSGEGAYLRQDFCKKLMEYKPVDCPGRVLHNMDADDLEPRNGDWYESKIDFLKKYKFTIAFENSLSNGYTTEKLIQPFYGCSVPIYWGNPLVVRDFNPKAFINCNDYDNDFDAVIERIKYLDTHDDEYLEILRQPVTQKGFDFNVDEKLEKWLCDIIEKGNKPFNKDPRGWSTNSYKNQASYYSLEKRIDTVIAEIKSKTETIEKRIDTVVAGISTYTQKELQRCHMEIQKNHKKTRKYFNVLLVGQIIITIFMIVLLF